MPLAEDLGVAGAAAVLDDPDFLAWRNEAAAKDCATLPGAQLPFGAAGAGG